MKKLFLVLLVALLFLPSCTSRDYDISKASTDADDETSRNADDGDVDVAELKAEAQRLLALDAEVAGIFAKQSLAQYASLNGDAEVGSYYALSEDCPYKSFSAVKALLDSVYSDFSGMKEYYLSYPNVGKNALRNKNGSTEINLDYKSDCEINPKNAVITFLSQSGPVYQLQYSEGSNIYTFSLRETGEGLRLDKSLHYMYEQLLVENQPERILSTQNTGNAKKLRGQCDIIHVFVDTPTYSWTEDATAAVKARLAGAWAYLNQQASGYGVEDLRFAESYITVVAKENIFDGSYPEPWVLSTIADMGHKSFDEIATGIGVYGDNYTVFFHINGEGRSFSITDNNNGYWEYSVLFHSDEGPYKSCTATYIHELLHNFGAVDLYAEVLSPRGEALASVYFPDDIMRIVNEDTYKSTIGLLTARLIGWCDKVPLPITEFLNQR